MTQIKTFLQAGILGTLTYYIVSFVITTLITGSDSVTTFFKTIVPLGVAFGIVWIIISSAFKSSD